MLKNVSRAYTTTTGDSGVYILDGGPSTSKLIQDEFATSDTHTFYIANNHDFELFRGEFTEPDILTVLEIYESSNNDELVDWSGGRKTISAVARAADFITDSERAAIQANASGLAGHAANTSNPHSVTRAQIGAAPDKFAYKTDPDTPILIVISSQSQGFGFYGGVPVTPFNENPRVRFFNITTPSASPTLTPANWSFQTITNAMAATSYVPVILTPYVGQPLGGYTSIIMNAADEIQRYNDRDVLILSVCSPSAPFSQWASGGVMRTTLDAFTAHVLSLPELAGVTAADIVIKAQGESDANRDPLDYKDDWLDWYNAATYIDKRLTLTYLIEFTDFYKEDPYALANSHVNWEGHRTVARYTPNNVQIISGVGVAYGGSGNEIHYSGDGINNTLSYRISEDVLGRGRAKSSPSMRVELDRFPVLGGDIDFDGHSASNVSEIEILGESTLAASLAARITNAGDYTYDFSSAFVPGTFLFGGTHTFEQAASAFGGGTIFSCGGTIQNASGEANTLNTVYSLNAHNTFQANNATVTMTAQHDIVSLPTFKGVSGGALTVTLADGFYSGGTVSSGATLSARHGYHVYAFTVGGNLTRQSGVTINALSNATHNTHLLLGTGTIPDSSWGIYQGNTTPHFFGGNICFPYAKKTAAATLTRADRFIEYTSATAASRNLTAFVGASTDRGFTVTIINDSAHTINFLAGSGQSLSDGGSITTGGRRTYVFDGVSKWFDW